MIKLRIKKRSAERLSVCIATLILQLAGVSYGWGIANSASESSAGDARLGKVGNPAPAGSGQVAAGSELALRIEGRKKVRVLTREGRIVLYEPIIMPEGIATKVTAVKTDSQGIIPWSNVQAIQVRKSAVLNGAVIGGAIGAGLGLLVGLASTRQSQGWMDLFSGASFGDVVLVTAFGGISWGLTGALIGAVVRKWGTVYSQLADFQKLPRVSISPTPRGGLMISLSLVI